MALNRTVRSTEGVDPSVTRLVDVINGKWSELQRAIQAIQFGLDKVRYVNRASCALNMFAFTYLLPLLDALYEVWLMFQ